MTIYQMIEGLCEWTEVNIAPKIKLLKASKDALDTMDYELVHPAVYPMSIPYLTKMDLDDVKQLYPSITILLNDGGDNFVGGLGREANIRMIVASWRPGKWLLNEEGKRVYKRTMDGWIDLWRSVDIIADKLRETDVINSMSLNRSRGIRYGQIKDAEGGTLFYPFWFAYIDFSVSCGLHAQARISHKNLL